MKLMWADRFDQIREILQPCQWHPSSILHSKLLSIVISHQGLKRYWHPEVPFRCPHAFIQQCPPSRLPSGGHRLWVLSFITASLEPRAWVSTARSCSPHLPSLLLLPFSNRVAFSSFICLLGWYVIRAGVLMGNTKWFFRGVGFESECYSCPFHLLCLLPWACQHQKNRKSLWMFPGPSCFCEIWWYLCQYRLLLHPSARGNLV